IDRDRRFGAQWSSQIIENTQAGPAFKIDHVIIEAITGTAGDLQELFDHGTRLLHDKRSRHSGIRRHKVQRTHGTSRSDERGQACTRALEREADAIISLSGDIAALKY